MRILFLNHNVAWRGGFFRAYHWGRHLKKKGHKITIITISEGNYLRFSQVEKDGVLIVKSPDLLKGKLRSGWDIWDTLSRVFYLHDKRYDIIHCVDSRPNVIIPGLLLKMLGRGKLVLDWGDWWGRGGTISERSSSRMEDLFAPVETFFEEFFRRYADGSVVLCEELRKRALALGVDERRCIRVPHGADTVQIVPRDKYEARKKLGIGKDTRVVGHIGAIFRGDADLLLSSFEILMHELGNIRLLIIGNCNASFPDSLVKNKKILLTGKLDLDMLLDYVAACDAMLLPLKDTIANRGRWPSKVCDYLAAAKPVVSTEVGDISLLLRSTQAGALAGDTPTEFADAVLKVLNHNSLDKLGENARELAKKALSWDILTDKLEAFYSVLLRD